jgi:hypothetical protein
MGIGFFEEKYLDCYCAFCRNPRRIYRKKHLTLMDYGQALGLSVATSILIYGNVRMQSGFFFIVYLCLFEFLMLFRNQKSLPCSICGFDPRLYVQDPTKACEKVKFYLKHRGERSQDYLRPAPQIASKISYRA